MDTNKRPVIGISASVIVDQGGMFPGYHRSYVNEDYVTSVIKNGGIPLILPISAEDDVLDGYFAIIDGLILSGGHDVSPFHYGEEPTSKLGDTFPERDIFDFDLLRRARSKNIPVLGICRGYQIINVFHGGNLWQDLSYTGVDALKHWQAHFPEMVTHTVDFEAGSRLAGIFGVETTKVNSFHHQVVRDVAPGFVVAARAKDGLIEAIEDPNHRFMVGVQWHPEMLHDSCPEMNKLFQALITESSVKPEDSVNKNINYDLVG